MKYLRKLAGILFLPILLIILTNCNNTGSNASSSGGSSNSGAAAATAASLTVQESTGYGSVGANSTNVSRHPSIVLVFSAPINKNTVTTDTIGIYAKNSITGIFDQAQPLSSFYFNNDATTVIFSPLKLASNTEYRVVVSTGVQASSGASLAAEFSMAFTTGTSEAPTAAILNPLGSNSPMNTPLQIIYSESGMKGASNTSYVKITKSPTFSTSDKSLTINSITPDATNKIYTINCYSFESNTVYYVYLMAKYGSTYNQIYNYTSSGSQIALETDGVGSSYYYKKFGFMLSSGSSTTVSMSQPVNGASGVSPSTPIKLVFTNSINVDTLDGQISLHKGSATGEEIPSTFDASTNPTVTVKPTSGVLPTASAIYVVVGSGILDSFGHYVTTPSTPFTFSTSDSTSPILVDVTPANGSTLITDPNPSISLTFSTNMDSSSVKNPNNTLLLKNGNLSESVPIMITGSGTSYIITPYQTLANNSNYTLLLESAIIDTSGNHLTQTKVYYTTGGDKTAPTLKVLNTENGFLSPRTNPHNIQVWFSNPMVGVSESTVTIHLISSVDSGSSCLSTPALGTYKMIDNGNNTYTIPLIESLTYQTTSNYYVCLTGAVKDTSGNIPSPNYAEFNTFLYDVNNEIQGYWSSNKYVVESVSTVSTTDQYGNIYIAGQLATSSTSSTKPFYLLKYNSSSVEQWEWICPGGCADSTQYKINKILLDSSGNIYVSGLSYKNDTDSKSRIFIAQFSSDGSTRNWAYEEGDSDYSEYYQARGATIVGDYLYVTGSKKGNDDNDIDGFVYRFNIAKGDSTPDNKMIFYPNEGDDGDKLYSNAIIPSSSSDGSNLYIVGRTQNTISGVTINSSKKSVKPLVTYGEKDSFQGFIMEIKKDLSFVTVSQFGTLKEHNDDDEGTAIVDAQDIVVHNYNGCQYKVIVGGTNYQLTGLTSDKKYLPSDGNKGAFLFYIPVTSSSSSCAVFSTEFGADGYDTIAKSVTQLNNGAMYVAGTTTGSLSGWINWSYPGNPAPFIAVKDQYSTTEKSWSPSEWVEFSSSMFQTLSTITSNPNDQNQRMYVSGVKQNKGAAPMYYAYLISHF